MTRSTFGGTDDDYVSSPFNIGGRKVHGALPNTIVTFWSAKTGGTQYTDLLNEAGGAVASITSDADGFLPQFQGPDGVLQMWADAGGGRKMLETRSTAAVSAAVAAAAASAAAAAAVGTTTDTIIAGRVNDGTSATRAALDPVYNRGLNVTTKGATGNGTTDDTTAIHAARDAAAAFGANLYFPPGTYKSTSLSANVAGQRWDLDGATILGNGGSTHGITVAASKVTIRGGKVDGNATAGACVVVNTTFTNVTVEGVELTNATYGVRGGGTTSAVLTGLTVRNNYIHDLIAGATNHAIFINGGADKGAVTGNRIDTVPGNGVYVGNGSTGLRCTNNTITNSSRVGIEVIASPGCVVTDNSISTVTSYGVSISASNECVVASNRITSPGTGGIEAAASSRVVINGNTVIGSTLASIQINCNAGDVSDDLVITGNLISNPSAVGIAAAGSSTGAARGGVVSGNTIINAVGQAIFLASTIAAPDWTISNNHISFTTAAASGIVVQQNYTAITGNQVYYASTLPSGSGPGISLSSGLGNRVTGNTIDGNGKCTTGIGTGTGITKSLINANYVEGTTTNTISVAATDVNATITVIGNHTDPTSGSDLNLAAGAMAFGNRRRSEAFTRTDSAHKFVGNVGFYGTTPAARPASVSTEKALETIGLGATMSRQVFNVKDYGAVGNGTTDDSAAIQAAITAASTVVAGGTVFFPPGFYNVLTGLTLTAPNIKLLGAGPGNMGVSGSFGARDYGTSVIHSAVTGLVLLTIGTTSSTDWRGPTIEGLTFLDSSGTSDQLAGAILVQRMNNGVIRNVGIPRMVAGYGIKANGTSGNPQYWLLDRVNVYQALTGIDARTGADWTITNGTLWGVSPSGAGVVAGSYGIRVSGSAKVMTTSVQYFDTEIEVTGDHNQILGGTFEASNSHTTPVPTVGVDVLSGVNNYINAEMANVQKYSAAPIRINAAATRTVVDYYRDTGSGTILDSGVDTTLTGKQQGWKIAGNIGFFGTTPIAKRATTANATDLATAITLVNALKADLQAYGLKS